jgi:hypothetical protein
MEATIKNYIIYRAQNIFTNEVYIGATTKSIEERKTDHIQKANKEIGSYFQEAISIRMEQMLLYSNKLTLLRQMMN